MEFTRAVVHAAVLVVLLGTIGIKAKAKVASSFLSEEPREINLELIYSKLIAPVRLLAWQVSRQRPF